MHVPGHNPFIEFTSFDPYLGAGYQDFVSAQTPSNQIATFNALNNMLAAINAYQSPNPFGTYQYQGINDSIQGALTNVFGGLPGYNLDDEIASIQNLYEQDYADDFLELSELGALLQQDVIEGLDAGSDSGEAAYYGSGLAGVNIFDPESIAATLSQIGNKDIQAAEVKALTPEMIEKTTSEYYSPYEESERQSLVEKLGTAIGKAQTGGFAGSGARQSGLSGAERLYRGGYGDILSDIMKMRGQATGDVLDTIYGYQELLDQT